MESNFLLFFGIFSTFYCEYVIGFEIIWNVPTQVCRSKYEVDVDVSQYGIKENPEDGWKGPIITLLYSTQMGLYPRIDANGTHFHGGLPQKAMIPQHMRRCMTDINKYIPEQNFSGLAVIDYESWRPIFKRNFDAKLIYQNESKDLVAKKHPHWSKRRIEAEAEKEFETAARLFLNYTLQIGKRLRPNGLWGYYLFPNCYNGNGYLNCSSRTRQDNDRLKWLFGNSTALFPSSYLKDSSNHTRNKNHVYGTIREALRLRYPSQPVYLYSRVRYVKTLAWYDLEDLKASIGQAKSLGIDGIVLWDDHYLSDSEADCSKTKAFVDNVLGPYVNQLLNPSILYYYFNEPPMLDNLLREVNNLMQALKRLQGLLTIF